MNESNLPQLPELFTFEKYQNDWVKYENGLYQIYLQDLYLHPPTYLNKKVSIRKNPLEKNKHWSFWHLTHEGPVENERTADLRRCERLGWIKPMIAHYQQFAHWQRQQMRGGRLVIRHKIWNPEGQFIVILDQKAFYYFLVTAYYIDDSKRTAKFYREWQKYGQKRQEPHSGLVTPSTRGR